MSVCTFFGHRECPESIQPVLYHTLEELILTRNADLFYVGNQGQFDGYARSALRKLSKKYPHIHYAVVLAYMPGSANAYEDYSDTMLPEGIETVHPKYAIAWRNNWMLQRADFVVTYITRTWGGAYSFARKAKRQGKTLIPCNTPLPIPQ